MRLTDAWLFDLVRRRLAQFRKPADRGDKFADQLVSLVANEIVRRNRLYDGWEAKARAHRAREADEAMRQFAMQSFDELTISDSEEVYRQ